MARLQYISVLYMISGFIEIETLRYDINIIKLYIVWNACVCVCEVYSKWKQVQFLNRIG